MGQLVEINQALPAIFRDAAVQAVDEFTGGVVSGFPVISYRGRTWRVKKGGEEQVYLNDDGEAMQSIELVLLKANPTLGKIYYEGAYSEGDNSPPTCWSADGHKPDVGVQNPQSATCAGCPHNVWGSRITESGKKTRACSDHRRMAVVFREGDHGLESAEPMVLLLRVPPASLNPLKDYIEKMLAPKGVPPFAVFTKIGFDTSVSHPQFTFKGVQFLDEAQGAKVMELRDSDETQRILSEAKEYSPEGTPEDGEAAESPATGKAEASPAPSGSKPKPPKLQPAAEEELNSGTVEEDDAIAPAAAPVTAEPGEEIAPAAPKKANGKAKPKAKKAAKPAAEATAPTPAGEGGDPSFDDMLAGLLDT